MKHEFRESAKALFSDFGRLFSGVVIRERATIVIPAFNEEKTIEKVLHACLKSRFVDEVIVVDDGSADGTAEKAKKIPRVTLVRHEKNMGKGRAIKTGIQNAGNDAILFLDADLQNISVEKIERLLSPLLGGKADFVKAGFSRARGRVTEFAAKPMMQIFYPQHNFSQPISGQFGGRKEFLQQLDFGNRWGVDISIFLDALKKKIRVKEVDIGEIVHKARPAEELSEMSRQVMETMLQKSGVFADKFRTMAFSEAALFPGKKQAIEAQRVVKQLQKRKYRVIIFGFSGREALEEKARRLGLDGYILLDSGDEKNDLVRSFKKAVKKNGAGMGETAVIAARTEEEGLMEAAGCGVYFGKNPVLEKKANRAIKSLAEALLLEEE